MRPPRRRKDSGFALLLVLLMGAVIAITLYMEIPRIAFDTQRQKEQLLIERGEQYKRAIQLFVSANNRWPTRIEELETFNNRHYLRKRFKDPITGKDEWRIVHIQNGVLTDSVTTKQQQTDKSGLIGNSQQYVGEQAGIGQAPVNVKGETGGVNLAMRQRASDRLPGGGGPELPPELQANMQQFLNEAQRIPGQPQQFPGQVPQFPGQPQQFPGQFQQFPGQPQQFPGQFQQFPGQPQQFPGQFQQFPGQPQQFPGQTQPFPGQPNSPLQPGFVPGPPVLVGRGPGIPVNPNSPEANYPVGGSVGTPGAYVGGGYSIGSQATPAIPTGGQMMTPPLPPQPGGAVNSQFGAAPQQVPPYPIAAGSSGPTPNFPQPGMQITPQSQNAAAQMISQILTTPRPGGMPQAVQGGIGGTGMAGIASNAEDDSIMVYNDRSNYGEWEFIFDPLKRRIPPDPTTGQIKTATAPIGQQPQPNLNNANPNTPGPAQPPPVSPFGSQPIPAGFPPGIGGGRRQ